MGPAFPEAPGYDPVIQAMAGYMEVTGERDGPPMLTGIPVIDLKAGDELYANVMLALLERHESGIGTDIHVSMLQAAASWLITVLPLIDFDCQPDEITRAGNEHRKFIPTNVYPTSDGYVFLAIGSDVQWRRLTAIPKFTSVGNEVRQTNEGRHAQRAAIHRDMAAVTSAAHCRRDPGRPARRDHSRHPHPRHPPDPRAAATARQADPHRDARRPAPAHAADGGGSAGRQRRTGLSAQVRPAHHAGAGRDRPCRRRDQFPLRCRGCGLSTISS